MIRESPALGVRERVFNVQLDQLHPPNNEDELISALIQAIRGAFDRMLERPDIHDRDRIYFQLPSNRLPHVFHRLGLTAGSWRRQTPRALEILNNMAERLKLNQQFDYKDTFTLSLVHVQGPNVGGGKRKKCFVPGKVSFHRLRAMKKCIVPIPQNIADNLCCALSIIVAKV